MSKYLTKNLWYICVDMHAQQELGCVCLKKQQQKMSLGDLISLKSLCFKDLCQTLSGAELVQIEENV